MVGNARKRGAAVNLLTRKLVGTVTRPFYPGFGHCAHCGRAWAVCRAHYLRLEEDRACLTLCVDCNTDLTPEQKLSYYQRLATKWANQYTMAADYESAANIIEYVWPLVRTAVMEGK